MSNLTANTLLAFVLLTLAGCARDPEKPPTWYYDQGAREEAFATCMRLLPAGPQATQYNDWDEVVSACDDHAEKQSYRSDTYRLPQKVEK